MITAILDTGETLQFENGQEMLAYAYTYDYDISECEDGTFALHSIDEAFDDGLA